MVDVARFVDIDVGLPRFIASSVLMIVYSAAVSVGLESASVSAAVIALYVLVNAKPLLGLVKRSR